MHQVQQVLDHIVIMSECGVWGRVGEQEEMHRRGNLPQMREQRVICLRLEGPRDWVPTALVMMVIDAGTIQTPQTPKQIKRLFCKVVKEQNGKGEWWAPPSTRLLCSVTPSASLWFPWCHQSLREESYYKPFFLTHTGYTNSAACAHMGVCTSAWTEGKYGSMLKGETVWLSNESVDESQQANIDEASRGILVWIFSKFSTETQECYLHLLCISSLSVHDLQIIYSQFEFNWPGWPKDAGCVSRLGAMCVCAWVEEIEGQTVSGYRQSSLRGGRLTCQRSNQCQVGSEASWAALAHALCSSRQLLSVIRSVCKGRRSGAGVGAQPLLIERSVLVCMGGVERGWWSGGMWGLLEELGGIWSFY